MKKILFLAVALMFLGAFPAFAHTPTVINTTVHEDAFVAHSTSGAKIDAPNLIGLPQISKYLFIGVEGGKEILADITNPLTRSYFEDDKGYFGYVKVSYNGCLFNCPSK